MATDVEQGHRLREIVDREAAAAEVDDDEGAAEEGEDSPEPEPEPAEPPPAPESAEQTARLLTREDRRHEKALAKVLGVEPPLEPCTNCSSLGYFPPGTSAPVGNAKYIACPTCNAIGQVLTGSRNPQHAMAPCPECGGRGFLERIEQPASPPAPGMTAAVPNGSEPQYGRPTWMGDPNLQPGA